MGAKVALFFVLDSSKASTPQNYGMQLPVQKVVPLYDSLGNSCRFAKMSFPDSTVYGLSYFKKPFAVDMLVVVREMENFSYGTILSQCQGQLAKMLNTKEVFFHEEYLHRALWLGRGLQKAEFVRLVGIFSGEPEPKLDQVSRLDAKDFWVMNWRKGFIFGGRNEADFGRTVALYGLGLAYHRVLANGINRLSQAAGSGGEGLSGLRIDASRFRAHFFFSNPVRPSETDLVRVYRHLSGELELPLLMREFDDKLDQLSRLAGIREGCAAADGEGFGDLLSGNQETEQKVSGGLRAEPRRQKRPVAPAQPSAEPRRRKGRGLMWLVMLVLLAGLALLAGPESWRSGLKQWLPTGTGMSGAPSGTAPPPSSSGQSQPR